MNSGSSLEFRRRAATRSSDSYISDPAKPVTYRARPMHSPWAPGSTWKEWLADDQRFADGRTDVLSYTGPVLTKPLKLAGTPLVHLVAATSGSDSDWVVKLIDVYPALYPQKPELGGYQFADRDGRHPRPLPERSGAAQRDPLERPARL